MILRSDVPAIFSAGADIAEFAAFRRDPAAATRFRLAMRRGIEAVAALPMPVIAVIDGGCYGAAIALILACDPVRRGRRRAIRFDAPPSSGSAIRARTSRGWVAQVGKGNAARMLFTGEIVDAADAMAMGLVELRWEEPEPLARAFADRIAANAPGAMRLLKATLADPADPALDAAFDARFAGAELAEGLAAFRERRRPAFP